MSVEKAWYVVHTYSGYENKVKANLERRVASMAMEDHIFRVLVPMEEEYEYKDGKRKLTKKKSLPGLRIGGDDHDRRLLVCGAKHARGDRFCWSRFRSPFLYNRKRSI